MRPHYSRYNALLFGAKWPTTRRALLLAGTFVVATVTLKYLVLLTAFENDILVALSDAFELNGYAFDASAQGSFTVAALAAVHAYLNEGYLPSVLVGWAPAYGVRSWTIYSLTEIENYHLDLVSGFTRTFPEAVVLATVGFVVGVGARWFRQSEQNDTVSNSDGDDVRAER